MIEKLIAVCVRNKFLTIFFVAAFFAAGLWALKRIPLDALPDLSDVQVIVYTNWEGQNPNLIEDQVTYPIVSALISAPKVKTVRGYSFFGFSYVYVIFQDGTDLYWASSRVLEYLNGLRGQLPEGVNPNLGPDATGVGWGFQYVLRGQDRPQLARRPADVPGLGPLLLAARRAGRRRGLLRRGISEAIPDRRRSGEARLLRDRPERSARARPGFQRRRRRAGGRVDGARVHGARPRVHPGPRGPAQDRGQVPRADGNARVSLRRRDDPFGPEMRRGVLDWNGEGEAVGGVVVVRAGENVARVVEAVKEKIAAVKPSFPPGVELEIAYDRTELIERAVSTLKRTLIEEVIVVAFVILIFLFHFRSALVPITVLPVAIVISFLPMALLRVSSNIMSLGGLALAIGVLVDASIVMVENAHRHLAARGKSERTGPRGGHRRGRPAGRPARSSSRW